MQEIEEIKQEARRLFFDLAAQGGLDPGGYHPTFEWIKNDSNRLHIVQKYESPTGAPLILKKAAQPNDPEEFASIIAAHLQAQEVLAPHPVATVPQIYAVDHESMAYLMGFQAGDSFLELCRNSADHRDYLRKAGQWLAAYHSGTFQQERIFQPEFMAKHMLKLAGQMVHGERKIMGQKRFIELAHIVQNYAGEAEGQISKVAAKHGDFNAHNLLIGEHAVAGLDFLAQSHAPVGYDIARFLLSYAQNVADLDRIPKGHVVPPDALDAFFDGYDFVTADDPGVRFLTRIQILTDWNRIRPKENAQTLIRFERLRKIARLAFA